MLSTAEAIGDLYDSTQDNYVLYLDRANGELRFKVATSNGAAERPGASAYVVDKKPGQWVHVVVQAVAAANGVQPMEDKLVSILHANYGNSAAVQVFIQSCEVSNLQSLNGQTDIRIVQLLNGSGRPYDFTLGDDVRS